MSTPSSPFMQLCSSTVKSATYTAGRGIKSGAICVKDAVVNDPKRAVLVVGGALVTAVAVPVVLSAAGFSAGGVVAGSVAAKVQSVVYAGATTGAFSALQSAGAAGVGVVTTTVAGMTGAVGGAAIAAKAKL